MSSRLGTDLLVKEVDILKDLWNIFKNYDNCFVHWEVESIHISLHGQKCLCCNMHVEMQLTDDDHIPAVGFITLATDRLLVQMGEYAMTPPCDLCELPLSVTCVSVCMSAVWILMKTMLFQSVLLLCFVSLEKLMSNIETTHKPYIFVNVN